MVHTHGIGVGTVGAIITGDSAGTIIAGTLTGVT